MPFVELDAVYWQPGWTPLPGEQFRRRVDELTAGSGWVVDGNRSAVRDLDWRRADTVVWLDPPRWTVLQRVVGRTVWRTVTRQELWNSNREPLTGLVRLDPEKSIIRWAWTRHDVYPARATPSCPWTRRTPTSPSCGSAPTGIWRGSWPRPRGRARPGDGRHAGPEATRRAAQRLGAGPRTVQRLGAGPRTVLPAGWDATVAVAGCP